MRKIKSFRLMINEKNIETKKFVREFIGNTVLGMVETLRLKDPDIKKIFMEIEYFDEES